MNQEQSQQFLGTEKISKLMLKFSIPCVLSLLISALYNIIDQIFIGNSELSTLDNAATGVVFPFFIVAQAFAWCFGDGCAADYVLREYENVVRIFIYAPEEYKIKRVMELYGDNKDEAKKNVRRSDEARASYYNNISQLTWGDRRNYELMIDSSIGIDESVETICAYLKNR